MRSAANRLEPMQMNPVPSTLMIPSCENGCAKRRVPTPPHYPEFIGPVKALCAQSAGNVAKASAADLKFLQQLLQARSGTSNREAALES
jgi:hypothetical protein